MTKYNARLQAQKTRFIQALLDGKREISEFEAETRRQRLGIEDLKLPCYVVCIAPYYNGIGYEERDRVISECEAYIVHLLEKHGYVVCSNVDSCDNIRVILHTDSENDLDEQCLRIHRKVQAQFGMELFIGIGSRAELYSRISVSAMEATEMLAYKYQFADRGVINISNIVRFRHNISNGSNEKYARVLGCFKDGDLGKMGVRLDELIEDIRFRPHVSGTSIKRTVIELTVNMLHIASSANVEVDKILEGNDPYRWILQQQETPVITEWFLKLASRLIEEMAEQRTQRQKGIIQDACNYIELNISDNGLGLQAVSESVGLSAPYFSQLFKNEKNVGLNNYIAGRRVELAKILLRDTKLKNEDIALQLGFARTNYFSFVFKKMTGISPGEYRKKALKEME